VLLGPANCAYHLKRGGANMEGGGKLAAGKNVVCPMASTKKGKSEQKGNMIGSNMLEEDADDTESGDDVDGGDDMADDTSDGLKGEEAAMEGVTMEGVTMEGVTMEGVTMEEATMEEAAMAEAAAEEAAVEEGADMDAVDREAAELEERQYNEMKQRKWKTSHGTAQGKGGACPKKKAVTMKGGCSKAGKAAKGRKKTNAVKAHSNGNFNMVNALKAIESHDNSSEGTKKSKRERGTNEENESLYEEKKQKIMMIHLLKSIKEHLDRQKKNFNSFLSFLSESYESYERFYVFKSASGVRSGVGEEMAITSQSFLSLQEESAPRCGEQKGQGGLLKSGGKSGGGMDEEGDEGMEEVVQEDAPEDEDGEGTSWGESPKKGEAPQNGGGSQKGGGSQNGEAPQIGEAPPNGENPADNGTTIDDQDKDSKKPSEKIQKIKDFLYDMLQSKELSKKQKEYLKVILQILTLEDDLLQKEKLQVEVNKKIIDVLLGKSNELRNIAVHLSKGEGAGETEGNQRVDLAQNIVSNLLNFSVELKNTGNIVYNNIQGQGELLQSIEKNINKAEDELKNVRVHTEYKGKKKEEPPVDPSNNDVVENNKEGPTSSKEINGSEFLQYCDAAEAEADSDATCPFKPVSSSKKGSAAMNHSTTGATQKKVTTKATHKKFILDETMKNHFFNNFVKDSVTLKKLYRLLYDMF
ncbi:hypothetical protein PCYB_032600, partial [Plasmodium cynomolgi strain B]